MKTLSVWVLRDVVISDQNEKTWLKYFKQVFESKLPK